jgi:hypothetical protein
MDVFQACVFLDISSEEWASLDMDMVNRQYRKMSLKCHPDKNRDDKGACERFRQLSDAKKKMEEYLDEDVCSDEGDWGDECGGLYSLYKARVVRFLKGLMGTHFQEGAFEQFCRERVLVLAHRMDVKVVEYMYRLLETNREPLEVSDAFLDELRAIVKSKQECASNTASYTIHPTLEDLLHDKVYLLKVGDETFYVPLWVDETEFMDKNGNTIQVTCLPQLPDNITIDEDNHIHVYHCFDRYNAALIHVLPGEGIAVPNDIDMYDVSRRSDVIVHGNVKTV